MKNKLSDNKRLLYKSRFYPFMKEKEFSEWAKKEAKDFPSAFSLLMNIRQYLIWKVIGEKSDSLEIDLVFDSVESLREHSDGESHYFFNTFDFPIPSQLPSYWKSASQERTIGILDREKIKELESSMKARQDELNAVLGQHIVLKKRLSDYLNMYTKNVKNLAQNTHIKEKEILDYSKFGFGKQIKRYKSNEYEWGEGVNEEDKEFLSDYLHLYDFFMC